MTLKTDEWETPHWLYDQLNKTFNFSLDVCATSENAKCPNYYTHEQDGLAQPWTGTCWMNPSYSRHLTCRCDGF